MTWGSCSLFPLSFAAKVQQFFPSFPKDMSYISTKTTVPWVCARLFPRMRRWLWDATSVGTATDDFFFPSGKAESDRVMEQGGGMSPMSREQRHVAVQVPSPGKCCLHVSKAVLTVPTLGLCQAN